MLGEIITPMNNPTHDAIARQAQRLWHELGCPEGHHEEIWLEAEDQLTNSPFGEEQKKPEASPDSGAGARAASS